MTTKYRKRTVYITVAMDIILVFVAPVIFDDGMNTVMTQVMCVSALLFTFLGTVLPLLDKFWDAIASFFYILAISLPVVVIAYGGISLLQLVFIDQHYITVYLINFTVVVYGSFGIAVVFLGKTHRRYPFWHKNKGGSKNQLGLQKIQGLRAYTAKDEK